MPRCNLGLHRFQTGLHMVQETLGRPLRPGSIKGPFAPSPNHFRGFSCFRPLSQALWFAILLGVQLWKALVPQLKGRIMQITIGFLIIPSVPKPLRKLLFFIQFLRSGPGQTANQSVGGHFCCMNFSRGHFAGTKVQCEDFLCTVFLQK